MATVRRPLANRSLPLHTNGTSAVDVLRPTKTLPNLATTAKRARSPDNREDHGVAGTKRTKCANGATNTATNMQDDHVEREKRKASRDAQKEEFRIKYTKAFPSWTFYFDTSDDEKADLASRILQLNGRVAKFFSNEVTHFISDKPLPSSAESNKENKAKGSVAQAFTSILKSPAKGRSLGYDGLMKKAVSLNMKIWDTAKLDSVLNRCLSSPVTPSHSAKPAHNLTQLLETERRLGTTSERDPTQKRHNYKYFSKNSYFVLVEDIKQEYATIIAREYTITKNADGKEEGDWPVPYCHPLARGPFIPYDAKEKKRKTKEERHEIKERERKALEINRLKEMQTKQTDLRRSASMNNIRRRATLEQVGLVDEDTGDSSATVNANASGYLGSASGRGSTYLAASGNSVGLTSNYGTTTSTAAGLARRTQSLPMALQNRVQNAVLTSRKIFTVDKDKNKDLDRDTTPSGSTTMPPPDRIPDKQRLRKSKSTTTMRLPKRQEDSKPGYCESCRLQFEDFKDHVKSRKHLKFALNDDNFLHLDYVLAAVKRRTKDEIEEDARQYELEQQECGTDQENEETEDNEEDPDGERDYGTKEDDDCMPYDPESASPDMHM